MLNWANVVIVNGAGTAAVAMIGADYLTPIILPPHFQSQVGVQLTAAGLTLFLLVINYLGIRTGASTQNILTIVKIAMMLVLAYAGLTYSGGSPLTAVPSFQVQPWWIALGMGLVPVFYAYGGYQNTLNFGGDIKGATRNIPRSIFFGILTILFLYLIINVAYERVLGIQGIGSAKLVAADVARMCFGQSASTIVSVLIFISAMGFVNVTMMQIPRTYYAMAEENSLPPIFGRVNERTQAQEFGLLFFGATTLLAIIFLGTFEKILNYVMFFDSLNNAIVASTIFALRRTATQNNYDGYCIPLYPILPGVFVLFLLFITVNVVLTQPGSILMGVIILGFGYPIFHVMRRVTSKGA
jgi:APA family basic amino acid/polyamine antiporter